MSGHLFTSARLGFRNWISDDIPKMTLVNADPKVMEFFPEIGTEEKSIAFIERMQKQFADKGFCYFAVERLDNDEFIGFIGISEHTFVSDFTPCIDIGWRLASDQWNNGFATEGAKACLDFAFNVLGLKEIFSMCPEVNKRSEAVMKKVGMRYVATFQHPLLEADERLQTCVLYEIERP